MLNKRMCLSKDIKTRIPATSCKYCLISRFLFAKTVSQSTLLAMLLYKSYKSYIINNTISYISLRAFQIYKRIDYIVDYIQLYHQLYKPQGPL